MPGYRCGKEEEIELMKGKDSAQYTVGTQEMWASLICANLLRQLLVYVFSELLVYSFIQLTVCDMSSPPFTGFKACSSGPISGRNVCQAVEELKSGQGESHICIRQHLEVLGGKPPQPSAPDCLSATTAVPGVPVGSSEQGATRLPTPQRAGRSGLPPLSPQPAESRLALRSCQ